LDGADRASRSAKDWLSFAGEVMSETQADLRKAARTWMRKKAAIRTRNGSLMHCIVMDLSREGACLQIAATLGVEGDIDLSFDNFHSHRRCKVVWRKANRLGVAFIAV
jgi:hypothetical protein